MTSWIHGDVALAQVERASRVMFGEALDGLTDADLGMIASTVGVVDILRSELTIGIGIIDLLVRTVSSSKSEARQLITQGDAYINNQRVSQVEHQVSINDLATETMLVVRGGRKDYKLVRAV